MCYDNENSISTGPTSLWVEDSFMEILTEPTSHWVEAGRSRFTIALWGHTGSTSHWVEVG